MKNRFLFSLFLLGFIGYKTSAQKTDSCYAGVYITKNDFLKNRLSHKINESAKGEKLVYVPIADLSLTIKIVDKDSTFTFKPGSIFGYYECGDVFRYSPGTEINAEEDYYKIEEAKELIIYTSALIGIGGLEIFYSIDLTSPIHRLTIRNLEVDFKNYPEFVKAAKKANRKIRGDIAARDKHGAFLVNKIYRETSVK
jgi:hypothetical protein